VYDKYLMDHHRAIMKVTELSKRGPFAQFLITALQRPECENLDVLALLITPVQRILRYKLFLEDLIKCTPEGHIDTKNINLVLINSFPLSFSNLNFYFFYFSFVSLSFSF
jgi:hypothetical protein